MPRASGQTENLRRQFQERATKFESGKASAGIRLGEESLVTQPEKQDDPKTNIPAFIKFVREHQCPSFLEDSEYPYFSSDEIKKALRLKRAFSEMLDQVQ
jgi:hypothetical protein